MIRWALELGTWGFWHGHLSSAAWTQCLEHCPEGENWLACEVMPIEPANIQQIGRELAISWNDGTESYLDLEFLRQRCPCAACGGEPDVLGNIARPNVTYVDNSFQLKGFGLVGGYALQPHWADGHNTGIYSFQYLRRLADSKQST